MAYREDDTLTRPERWLVRFGLAFTLMALLGQFDLNVQPWWQRYHTAPSTTVDAPLRSAPLKMRTFALHPTNGDHPQG